MNNSSNNVFVPNHGPYIEPKIKAPRNIFNIYKIHDNYNIGPYLYPYKCLPDISLHNCLRYCKSNDKCAGAEWNPSFITPGNPSQNVCCLKRQVGPFVQRKFSQRYGRFYEKKNDKQIYPTQMYTYN